MEMFLIMDEKDDLNLKKKYLNKLLLKLYRNFQTLIKMPNYRVKYCVRICKINRILQMNESSLHISHV